MRPVAFVNFLKQSRKLRLQTNFWRWLIGIGLLFYLFAATDAKAQKIKNESAFATVCWNRFDDLALSSPLVSDGENVYYASLGGRITAIETAGGQSAWNAELGGRSISNILVRDLDVVAAIAVVGESAKINDSSLKSLSKKTGIVNWSTRLPAAERYVLGFTAAGIAAVSSDGNVSLFGTKIGGLLWERPSLGKLAASPFFDSEHIVISTDAGNTYVISASDGSAALRIPTPADTETLIESNGKRLISGDRRGNLTAIDFDSGRRKWRFKAGAKWTFIVQTGYGIFAGSADNFVYMLSSERGDVIWKKRMPGRILQSPAVSDSFAIVAAYGEDSSYIIDLNSGKIVNRISLEENSSFTNSPVFVSSESVAAATNSGVTLWSFGGCAMNRKAAL